jgi:LPS export ABC transporter protein LptC
MRNAVFLFIMLLLFSCSDQDMKTPVEYNGPQSIMENVELRTNENGILKYSMVFPIQEDFGNGDRNYPKGGNIETYDVSGKLETTFRSDKAFFSKEKNQWRAQDNVQLKNLITRQQLNTEELYWDRNRKKIFTDKFVTIRDEGNIIYGHGFESNEDLSDYVIFKIEESILTINDH